MKIFSLSVHHKPAMKVVLTKMFSAVVQSGDLFILALGWFSSFVMIPGQST
jgi:hypothetical protein